MDLCGFIGIVFKAATPLIVGAFVAYILNILMSFYEKHLLKKFKKPFIKKMARLICMIGTILTLTLIVVLIGWLVSLELNSYVNILYTKIQDTINGLMSSLAEADFIPESMKTAFRNGEWKSLAVGISGVVNFFNTLSNFSINSLAVNNTPSFDISGITSIIPTIVNFVLSIVFTIYLLFKKENVQKECGRFFKNKKINYYITIINNCFHDYIVRRSSKVVVIGTLCTLSMLILRIPFPVTIGVIVGLTAIFPIAGACVGGFVGFILIYSVGKPIQAILFLIILIIIHLLESKVIYPKIVGTSITLPAIGALFAVSIGGSIWGILGMFIGVPIATIIYQILKKNTNKEILEQN